MGEDVPEPRVWSSWSCRTAGSGAKSNFPDIILPACTDLERTDLGEWAACGGYTTNAHIGNNYRVIVRQQKCLEPMGESKSDYEILTLIWPSAWA